MWVKTYSKLKGGSAFAECGVYYTVEVRFVLWDSGGLQAELPVLPPFEKRGVDIMEAPFYIEGLFCA
jgi:hypothetical protein